MEVILVGNCKDPTSVANSLLQELRKSQGKQLVLINRAIPVIASTIFPAALSFICVSVIVFPFCFPHNASHKNIHNSKAAPIPMGSVSIIPFSTNLDEEPLFCKV